MQAMARSESDALINIIGKLSGRPVRLAACVVVAAATMIGATIGELLVCQPRISAWSFIDDRPGYHYDARYNVSWDTLVDIGHPGSIKFFGGTYGGSFTRNVLPDLSSISPRGAGFGSPTNEVRAAEPPPPSSGVIAPVDEQDLPAWADIPASHVGTSWTHGIATRYGWPFQWLTYTVVGRADALWLEPRELFDAIFGRFVGATMPNLGVRPYLFAVNLLLYSAAVALLWQGAVHSLRRLRIRRRRARGLCPHCAYRIIDSQTRCPECGGDANLSRQLS